MNSDRKKWMVSPAQTIGLYFIHCLSAHGCGHYISEFLCVQFQCPPVVVYLGRCHRMEAPKRLFHLNWITGHTYIYMVRCGSDYSLLGEWRPICTCERAGWCWMVQLVSSREYQFLPEYTVLLWPDTCSKYWRVDRLAKSPPLAPIVYSVGQPRGGGR